MPHPPVSTFLDMKEESPVRLPKANPPLGLRFSLACAASNVIVCNCPLPPGSPLSGHKHTRAAPSYKALSLEPTASFSYHPISTLFTTKLLLSMLTVCVLSLHFFPHTHKPSSPTTSLEVALFKVTSFLHVSTSSGHLALTTLPLSAALDTADHAFLERLSFLSFYGIMSWISSHLPE